MFIKLKLIKYLLYLLKVMGASVAEWLRLIQYNNRSVWVSFYYFFISTEGHLFFRALNVSVCHYMKE